MIFISRFNKFRKLSLRILLFSLWISFSLNLKAQSWIKQLPQNKVKSHTLTLKDYQKAFKSYWSEEQKKEKKIETESEVRDENYEKFKRWEWYWETRVDPVTGAFPTVTAYDVYKQYLRGTSPMKKSAATVWVNQGPSISGGSDFGLGRINCVAFSPVDTSTLYVGAASGGVWKTTDLGIHWTPMGDFNNVLGVAGMVVVNNGGSDIIYLATGDKDHWDTYSIGVLKSTNAGVSWQKTGLNWSPTRYDMIYKLLGDPKDNTILYAAAQSGLYKTIDGAVSWRRVSALAFRDIEFQPGSDTWMTGSTYSGQIYYSKDGGKNWVLSLNVTDGGGRTELAVTPDSSNVVYAIMSDSRNGGYKGFYKSVDKGVNFTEIPDTLNLLGWNWSEAGGQAWYDLTIVADPNDASKVYVGGVRTWFTTEGGKSWNVMNFYDEGYVYPHVDKHELIYQKETHALFECNDGGIYKSNDGKRWKNIGNGLVTGQIYRIGVSLKFPGEVIAGFQDNETQWLFNGKWNYVYYGDGLDCQIDYANDSVQYGEMQNGALFRTKNYWKGVSPIKNGLPGGGAWLTPFVLDPKNHRVLYAAFQDVYKTTDQGDHWSKISNFQDNLYLVAVTVAPSNNKYIYTATRNKIFQTHNGGTTWSNITGSLPVNYASITNISVSDSCPTHLWVTLGGFNNYGVYETRNGGTTWNNISSGLPGIPINCVVQNKVSDTTQLYAGTDVGVFVRQGNSKWTSYMNSLPNVVVTDLEIQYDSTGGGKLYAGTFGRGLWSTNVFSGSLPQKPKADFRVNNTSPTVNDSVYFRDMSNIRPTSWKWVIQPQTITYLSGTDSTSQNPVLRFNKSGYYSVTLTAYGEDTLSRTIPSFILANKDTLLVTVTANRDKILKGDTTRISARVTGGYRSYSYSWHSNPQGFSSSEMNPVVTPTYDTTTYAVRIKDDDNEVASDSIVIYRVKKDTIHVKITSNRNRVFQGDTTRLFAHVTGGLGTYNYVWTSIPSGFNSTSQNPIVKPTIDSTLYSVEVSDGVNDNVLDTIAVYTFHFDANDSLALVDLYDSCNGPNWNNYENWLKAPVKDWYGIETSKGRVVGINLSEGSSLKGKIPKSIGDMTKIQSLNLESNNLYGQIPVEIGNLINLQNLSLAHNGLSGPIPPSIGSLRKLQSLDLSINNFSGVIPNNIGKLTQLQFLYLGQNNLSGQIPSSIGNLINIRKLFLIDNKLSGAIPQEIGNIKSLNWLSLSFNNFTGKVPLEVCNLTYLWYMDLSNNSFTSLPNLSSLGNLNYLFVVNNKLGFQDIVPNMRVAKFIYSPQAKVDTVQHYLMNPGDSLRLSVSDRNNANTYQWYRNGDSISGANDSVYIIKNYENSADSGTYICEIKNTIATALTLETNNIYVQEKTADFTADITKGAFPVKVNFTVNSNFTPTSWYWDFGDDSTSTKQNPTHTYQNMGTYSVSLIAKNQFGADTVVKSNYIKAEGIIISPDTVILSGTSPNQQSFGITSNVDWTISGKKDWMDVDKLNGSNNATVTVTAKKNWPGSDRVDTLTISNDDVIKTIIVKQSSLTGISNQEVEKSILIYPNPTRSGLSIRFSDKSYKNIILRVYNSHGKSLLQKHLDQVPIEPVKLNLTNYPMGVYYIQLITDKGTATKKIIIQR